jgi:hypothetical protein
MRCDYESDRYLYYLEGLTALWEGRRLTGTESSNIPWRWRHILDLLDMRAMGMRGPRG